MRLDARRAALLPALLLLAAPILAEEGMWTFDNAPARQLQQAFGFALTPGWLDKVRLASVRFNDGGSGSFVSADGLMITNHHVGLGCVQNLSTPENDYVASGYLASSRDREPACPGYEVNVLMAVEDVTARVLGAVKPAMSDKEAGDARKAVLATMQNLIYDEAHMVRFLTSVMTLYPGDVISTGTPDGVGAARKPPEFLKPGDVVEMEIEGIGKLVTPMKAAQAPTTN